MFLLKCQKKKKLLFDAVMVNVRKGGQRYAMIKKGVDKMCLSEDTKNPIFKKES